MKIATKTPGRQVKKNKIPLCLHAFVAEFSLVSGERFNRILRGTANACSSISSLLR